MQQASNAERVKYLAPTLIDMIIDFDNSNATDGVDAFQATVLKLIEQYGFIDHVDMHADKLGVHPDNRETAGLVAIDVHDLLLRIVHLGWNWSKVDILAAQIPPTEEGQRWRDFSVKVGASSDGLLAAVKPDELEACTGRGSHTTASVRCMLHGVPGIHEELCMDGNISLAKILETRPSMNEPIRRGLLVKRIKWEICSAVPQLMEMLSRSGNTSHSVNRKPTILQQLTRCHTIIVRYPAKSTDQIATMAAIGQELGFVTRAKVLIDYLVAPAGGNDGTYLNQQPKNHITVNEFLRKP